MKKKGETKQSKQSEAKFKAKKAGKPFGETVGKKETVYHFALTIATKAITYFLLIALANLFSLTAYGKASFAIMVYTIASMLVFPGLSTLLVPAFIKKQDAHSLFYFSGIATLLFAVGTLVASLRYPVVWPLALCLVFAWAALTAKALIRAKHDYHLLQATELLFVAADLVLVIYWRGLGDQGIIYALTVATFLSAASSVWIARKEIAFLASKPQIDFGVVKNYWVKGLTLLVVLLSFDVLGKGDSVILGLLSSFENVARYNISSAIAGVLTTISVSASMFLLTRSAELDEEKSESVFLRTVRIAFAFNLVAAIALAALAKPIISIFFKQYEGSEFYVALLTASTLFYSIYYLYVTHLTAQLKPEKGLKSIAVAAVLNVGLDLLLIPPFGVLGICVATFVAGVTAFSLAEIRLPLESKAFVYASPVFVAVAYYLGVLGLVVIVPAVALLAWSKTLHEGDYHAVKNVLKQIASRAPHRK